MDVTIFFARFYGILYIVLGLLSIQANFLRTTIDRTETELFTVATGYNSMMLGLVTIILHQVWVLDWPVLITILGWSTFIKGVQKTGFPDYIHKQAQRFRKNEKLSGAMLVLLGAILAYLSFYP